MTALEKLKIDHPEFFEEGEGGIKGKCPYNFEYFGPWKCYGDYISCSTCWKCSDVDDPEVCKSEEAKKFQKVY